jgi:ribosomal protein S18 acetylase RimI-like enzyme
VVDIRVFLPQTAEDIYDKADDLLLCAAEATGGAPLVDGYLDYAARYPHTFYLFYDGEKPLGFIRLDDRVLDPDLGKNTVEIHGAVLPEYRGQGVFDEMAAFVMKAAFKVKKNVIAKVPPHNDGPVGFCIRWGFTKINKEHGLDVYRLKRSEFLRMHDV